MDKINPPICLLCKKPEWSFSTPDTCVCHNARYWRKRCNALLEFIGEDVKECEGCGLIAEGSEHAYGPEGIDVCPDCRMVEGFKYLEQEAE